MRETYADGYERLYRGMLYPLYEDGIRRRRTFAYLGEYRAAERLSLDELHAIQWRKLTALLRHASEHVPFYRERWRAAGIGWGDIRSIAGFERAALVTQ